KSKLDTISGISNFYEWAWPVDDEEKIVKKRKLEKLNPICTSHSYSRKAWVIPIVDRQGINNVSNYILIL
ncbi:4625_t:CDS:2, partial [Gigaspora rosea]